MRREEDKIAYGRREENKLSAGRFSQPEFLPPTRTYRLQAGKFSQPQYLPPTRTAQIQNQIGIDWNLYHFHEKVSTDVVRGPSRRQ